MKTTILILLASIISFTTMGQKHHADNISENVEIIYKNPPKNVLYYTVVERFQKQFCILSVKKDEFQDNLSFRIAFLEDFDYLGDFPAGIEEMIPKKVLVAEPLTNSSGEKIDKYSPIGLIAEPSKAFSKKQKKRQKEISSYIVKGDWVYECPERISIEGKTYLFFFHEGQIFVTPVDSDLKDHIDGKTRQVSFINKDNFCVFKEHTLTKEKYDVLDSQLPNKKENTNSTHHIVKNGETLYGIAKKIWIRRRRLTKIKQPKFFSNLCRTKTSGKINTFKNKTRLENHGNIRNNFNVPRAWRDYSIFNFIFICRFSNS